MPKRPRKARRKRIPHSESERKIVPINFRPDDDWQPLESPLTTFLRSRLNRKHKPP